LIDFRFSGLRGLILLMLLVAATVCPAAISFVQQNSAVPQAAQSSVSVIYTAAQVGGDTNIVAVGWSDSTSSAPSVTDTKGNAYTLAVGPTRQTGIHSQVIYVAKTVVAAAASANTVTVLFSAAVAYPDVRILSYRGLDTSSPVEGVAGTVGTGTTPNSGSVTTTNANDLLFGASYVSTRVTAAGTGFTSRVITSPDGDIAEDRIVTAAGTYNATATMTSGNWVMQLVALKAAAAQAAAATPMFNPAPGTYATAQTVHLSDTTTGATIYYTLDMTTPTTSSSVYNDMSPIQVTANTTIKAMAAASGFANSAVATGAYVIQPVTPAATPTFNPAPGNYTAAQTVHLLDATSGATIYYTTNGNIPTTSSTVYNDATPIKVSTTTTVMAIAAAPGFANSAVATGVFSIGAPAAIAYVQSNFAVPQTPQASVSVTYTGAQTAGNLNVVVVGWGDTTSTVTSVTDTKGNGYQLASGPTVVASGETLAVYYAANIPAAAASGNAVKVTFNTAARYPDIRIAEYSGISQTAPLDTKAAAQGSGTAASSGAAATTNANDLLVGASQVQNVTTGTGSGYTKRLITSPNGDILEDQVVAAVGSYSATATISAGGWIMHMVAFRGAAGGGGGGPDTTPPNVSVTSPTAGSTLVGRVNISVTATDNTAVSGVQFQIDGVNVGPVVAASPYTASLDTTQFANGTHLVSAYAWDPARNIGSSASVSVTFSNSSPGNPAQVGLWSGTITWPLVAVHATLLSTGRVLLWDAMAFGLKDPLLWDPVTSGFTTVPTNDGANIFCSGHVQMADGRIIVVGGHVTTDTGLPVAHVFNTATSTWSSLPNMSFARWYPTATTLADGRILATAGEINCRSCDAVTPEIYDPSTNQWTTLSLASQDTLYYPHMFVLPDGRMLATGSSEAAVPTRALDIPTQTWTTIDARLLEGGSSAMYLPGKIIKNGTSRLPDLTTPQASSLITYVIDMTQASPAWTQVGSMAFPRAYHYLTVLPDGDVLVTGGGITSDPVGLAGSVLPAELWSATTQTWRTLSSMHSGRLYHSTTILLPDARVLIAGGGRFYGVVDPTDQLSAEIFSPPYLFKGPRPTIASAPSALQYGQSFTVQTPDAARIAKVSLVRLGASTHGFNQNQRFLPLTFTQNTGSLSVTAPANSNLAPPGDYMLFLVDTNGVPSVAKMVRF
jgi:galactose oxidase-like protein/chitobiase/beta-hexosaminidase-like protein/Big-like domain-containing protein/Kelch motif protein